MIHGKGICVDLSKKKSTIMTLQPGLIKQFLGGNGIGAHLLYEHVKTHTASSPDNWLVFVPGVLNGSTFPMTSKCGFFSLSPLTGAFGESYFGASLGVALKSEGYDFIALTGRCDILSYVLIDGQCSIEQASDLEGLTTSACETILTEKHDGSCACIGPAGEHQVAFAAIVGDGRQAGRTGMGAVLGSKQVKAIVVVPEAIPIDKKSIRPLRKKCVKGFLEGKGYPAYQGYHSFGTGKSILPFSETFGILPTENFEHSQFEGASRIDTTHWKDEITRSVGCHGCMIACGKVYKGISDPEFETLYALGSNLLCDDIEVIAEGNRLCDELGMDTISMGGVLGYVMSLSKEKILQEKIPFGHGDTILSLIEKTAYREGIGNELAEGVQALSTRYGNDYHAVHVLGLSPPAYDGRGIKGMALSFLTSPRGACHLRSSAYSVELPGTWEHFTADRFSSEGKEFVAWMENLMTVHDILGTCKFTRDFYLPDIMSEMLEAYTGLKMSPEELLEIGERTFNLEWMFNIRNGVRIGAMPPKFKTPIKEGPSQGSHITDEDTQRMKKDYCAARGWNTEGIPQKNTIERLHLPPLEIR
ncbi:MAG: aldehyde ferredoxin oxidoreductase family protein [Theionarchaea archaeon]|nr:aldehyde ferredoxin oxidoreductase family protein [Theionarchaea archaeon]